MHLYRYSPSAQAFGITDGIFSTENDSTTSSLTFEQKRGFADPGAFQRSSTVGRVPGGVYAKRAGERRTQ